jgi:hypothetical protein
MPRRSGAARAAEVWRVGIGHPKPRRGMPAAARRLWTEVVESRPADFFMPGAQSMLRTFCEVSAALEVIGPELVADPENAKLATRMQRLGALQSNLAARLRLTIQSSLRGDKAAVLERVEPARATAPKLLGGKASWRN